MEPSFVPLPDLERAAADRGRAGIDVRRGKDQRARANAVVHGQTADAGQPTGNGDGEAGGIEDRSAAAGTQRHGQAGDKPTARLKRSPLKLKTVVPLPPASAVTFSTPPLRL